MRFCQNCDNFLLPRNKKLFCRVCKEEFKFDGKTDDYIIVKTINHNEKEFEPIVIKDIPNRNIISNQERKAYEEFFQIG